MKNELARTTGTFGLSCWKAVERECVLSTAHFPALLLQDNKKGDYSFTGQAEEPDQDHLAEKTYANMAWKEK